MTKDEIIKLAREAGIDVSLYDMGAASCVFSEGCHGVARDEFQRFARACYEAGRTAERSACALEKDLMHEVLQVADAGFLPDGSLADTPTFMWSEEWQRKYQARGNP